MLRVSVLVSGGGTNLQAIIDRVEDGSLQGVKLVQVISNNPGTRALKRAEEHSIPALCLSPGQFADREAFHKALIRKLQEAQTDLVVLAGFLVVVSPDMVDAYENRIINIHPSLIPSFCGTGYYGQKVHEEALRRGVKVTGATVHFVDKGTDTGPILLQKAVAVRPDDDAKSLQRRVMEEAEWELLPKAIGMIAQGRVRVENGRTIVAPQD